MSTSMPLQATQTKLCKKGNTVVPLVQVRWSNMPASWTTWENLNMLQQQFPHFLKAGGE
jgi:hypothetical protein